VPFAQLDCAADLTPIFTRVWEASTWEARQTHLTAAYEFAGKMHNALRITEPLTPKVSQFHNRPFLVVHADRFVDAIRAAIKSEEVLALPQHLGSVDQCLDSTDALEYLDRFKAVYNIPKM